jgi:hypothetical protein
VARQYQEAFAKLDAEEADAILSVAAFVTTYADGMLANSHSKGRSTAQREPPFRSDSEHRPLEWPLRVTFDGFGKGCRLVDVCFCP